MEDWGISEQDLRPEELVALQVLLELRRLCGGHFESWGRKRRRSAVAYFSCNFESPSSDSAAGSPPCDLNLGPNVDSKVQGVQNPSNGKGPKKKTFAQLKELFIGLSLEKEEMEKEKEKLLNSFQSLTDENELLKRKLALKLNKKRQQRLDVSIGHDALESSLCAFGLPDLNIPAEDVEDLFNDISIYFDSQVVNVNSKSVLAAKARKYRMECLRLKHSQSVKARLRWH